MLDFIFGDVFQERCTWVTQANEAHIVYDDTAYPNTCTIHPHGLLFETGIQEQTIEINIWKTMPIFFGNASKEIPFDLFAAIFYLISRYEEYLPYTPDEFHRYPHRLSLAYQQGFIKIPLVDLWLLEFQQLFTQSTGITLTRKPPQFIPTYDIDIAYSYHGKSWARNIGGILKDTLALHLAQVVERIQVLGHQRKDPYDAYDFLDQLHDDYHLHPIYFFLLSEGGPLDKNLAPESSVMMNLLDRIKKKYELGIHPSFRSHAQVHDLMRELRRIPQVSISRQHYIRFQVPQTYRTLIELGIEHDYSMGYGSINGFRASTAHAFYWYDVMQDAQTTLRIHPFAFMECNTRFEQKQNAHDAGTEMDMYWSQVQCSGGQFITIWHNFSLGSSSDWKGWKEVYQQFLEENFDRT